MPQDNKVQKTILVVEDDSVLYESIELYFKRYGWNCEWFAYAPSSMDEVRALGADAGLIDVNLPAGNGLELIDSMRAEGIDMPIVVMTGYIGAAEQARARGATNMQVVMKPFNLANLRDKLSQGMDLAA